jgi:uncharacterized membrane protein YhaH (DUF805 family)
MDWKSYLFSAQGRLNRARYWLGFLVIYVAFMIVYLPFSLTLGPAQQGLTAGQAIYATILFVASLVITYSSICIGIKRWHDRDKSGWWMLIGFIPLIGSIWSFVELGCLRGTMGANRFGPDPLAPHDDIVRVFGASDPKALR